jgi:hypothetical protein
MPDVNCLNVERVLLGTMAIEELTPAERVFCEEKRPSFEVGRLASRMAQGYYGHAAAVHVAKHSRAKELAPATSDDGSFPIGYVYRKDGSAHTYMFDHYLDYLSKAMEVIDDLDRTWLVGSLLNVGDALAKFKYFDHAPELELLYHLRNGVADGNRFTFTRSGLARLKNHPAHNRLARVRINELEIVPSALQGKPVLFDFLEPTDVVELLQSIETYLTWICPRGRSLAHPQLRG